MISTDYRGLWLEHVYDSVLYARLDKSKLFLGENAINAFMDFQSKESAEPKALSEGIATTLSAMPPTP